METTRSEINRYLKIASSALFQERILFDLATIASDSEETAWTEGGPEEKFATKESHPWKRQTMREFFFDCHRQSGKLEIIYNKYLNVSPARVENKIAYSLEIHIKNIIPSNERSPIFY